MNKKICVVGGGRWGNNHIKTLYKMGNLGGVVDNNPKCLKNLLSKYSMVKGYLNIENSLKDEYNGYVISTPAKTHYEIGSYLIKQNKNVLIEKPLTISSADSLKLVQLSKEYNCKLMVGHLLLFHPAIKKIKEIIESGKIGKLLSIYSTRLNFGTVRTKENVFCSFAPHDISILDYLIGKAPISVKAEGDCFIQDNICDTVVANIIYPDNIKAHIFVSWLHPYKEQKIVIIGSKGMLSFEDSTKDKKIYLYDKKIELKNGFPIKVESPMENIEYEISSPLKNELEYFITHLDSNISIANGQSGYEVVKILEKVTEILGGR